MRVKLNNFSSPIFWSCLLVLTLGTVYVATLLPGVGYSGDTAKFQFIGKVLGTSHATGYPTYIMLNHFFTKLFPFGRLAYKANLLSAIFSVISALFLFCILKNLLNLKNTIAFITSLIFGFSPTFWSQSIVAEVYTLHILFITIVFYFLLKWNKTKKEHNFLFACAFYALSFGNHMTMLTLLPAFIYFVWATDKKVFFDTRKIFLVTLFIILGALQYLYLFWRYYVPETNYLEAQIPNFETFLWFVTGAQFKPQMFSFSIGQFLLKGIPMFIILLMKEYYFLVLISIFGMFVLGFKNKTTNLFLILCFLGNLYFALNFNIEDIRVYFIPNYLVIAIYIGIGLDSINTILSRNSFKFRSPLFILILVVLFTINYNRVNQRNNTMMAKKIELVLETVKRDAIIVSSNYYYSELFWYYLIGEDLERNNIYLMHLDDGYNIEEIRAIMRAYIYENKPFYLYLQRKHVPTGLGVYCIGPANKAILQETDFKLLEIGEYLYKVEPCQSRQNIQQTNLTD